MYFFKEFPCIFLFGLVFFLCLVLWFINCSFLKGEPAGGGCVSQQQQQQQGQQGQTRRRSGEALGWSGVSGLALVGRARGANAGDDARVSGGGRVGAPRAFVHGSVRCAREGVHQQGPWFIPTRRVGRAGRPEPEAAPGMAAVAERVGAEGMHGGEGPARESLGRCDPSVTESGAETSNLSAGQVDEQVHASAWEEGPGDDCAGALEYEGGVSAHSDSGPSSSGVRVGADADTGGGVGMWAEEGMRGEGMELDVGEPGANAGREQSYRREGEHEEDKGKDEGDGEVEGKEDGSLGFEGAHKRRRHSETSPKGRQEGTSEVGLPKARSLAWKPMHVGRAHVGTYSLPDAGVTAQLSMDGVKLHCTEHKERRALGPAAQWEDARGAADAEGHVVREQIFALPWERIAKVICYTQTKQESARIRSQMRRQGVDRPQGLWACRQALVFVADCELMMHALQKGMPPGPGHWASSIVLEFDVTPRFWRKLSQLYCQAIRARLPASAVLQCEDSQIPLVSSYGANKIKRLDAAPSRQSPCYLVPRGEECPAGYVWDSKWWHDMVAKMSVRSEAWCIAPSELPSKETVCRATESILSYAGEACISRPDATQADGGSQHENSGEIAIIIGEDDDDGGNTSNTGEGGGEQGRISPNDPERIVLRYPGGDEGWSIDVKDRDLKLLDTDAFINDTIIDVYLKYLKMHSAVEMSSQGDRRFLLTSTFLFKKLYPYYTNLMADVEAGADAALLGRSVYSKVMKWTTNLNFFTSEYVFIPVNLDEHWSLLVLCHPAAKRPPNGETDGRKGPRPHMLHLDSSNGCHNEKVVGNVIRHFVQCEWDQKMMATHGKRTFSEETMPVYGRLPVPQQSNVTDCGLFLMHFVQRFIDLAPRVMPEDPQSVFPVPWFKPSEGSALRSRLRDFLGGLTGMDHTMKTMPPIQSTGDDVAALDTMTCTKALADSMQTSANVSERAHLAAAESPFKLGVPTPHESARSRSMQPESPRIPQRHEEHHSSSPYERKQRRVLSSDKDKSTCETGESPADHVAFVKRNEHSSGLTSSGLVSSVDGFIRHCEPGATREGATTVDKMAFESPGLQHPARDLGDFSRGVNMAYHQPSTKVDFSCQTMLEVADAGEGPDAFSGRNVEDLPQASTPPPATSRRVPSACECACCKARAGPGVAKDPYSRDEIDILRRQRLYKEIGYFPQGKYVQAVRRRTGRSLTPPGFSAPFFGAGAEADGVPYVKHLNLASHGVKQPMPPKVRMKRGPYKKRKAVGG